MDFLSIASVAIVLTKVACMLWSQIADYRRDVISVCRNDLDQIKKLLYILDRMDNV